ncbi:MAG: helix-turn-helix domain-containing protein [Micromonosporaceae bacterium]
MSPRRPHGVRPNASAIRALRKAYGWTLVELAERATVSKSQLANIELGNRWTTIETLRPLAAAFKCDVQALSLDDLGTLPPAPRRAPKGPPASPAPQAGPTHARTQGGPDRL